MESLTQPQEKAEKIARTAKEQEKPAIAPGQMRVIKRNGSVVSYDAEKIAIAITKAFLAVEGGAAAASKASMLRETTVCGRNSRHCIPNISCIVLW